LRGSKIGLRQIGQEPLFEFVFPPCVQERAEDIAEVYEMLQMGESQAAQDELLWLLQDCPELLQAHQLLGELALAEGNLHRARAHFGRAYEMGLQVVEKAGLRGGLPADRPANSWFFYAGKGLAITFQKLNQTSLAREIIYRLLDLDPTDPLQLRDLLRAEGPR
jgi:tetratricopeptide (TPR) repeat protein